jgi:hypothetical protein
MDSALGTVAVAAGALIVGGTAVAFNRAGFKHRELGPWSVVSALLAYLAGLLLVLYGVCMILAPLGGPVPAARTLFYHAFVQAARLALVVMPMVLLQMPLTVLLVLRPVLAYLAILLIEALLGASLLTALATPVVLCVMLVVLRVDWARGRKRARAMTPDEELPADYYTGTSPYAPQPVPEPLHQRVTSVAFAQRPELSPAGPARGRAATQRGNYTVPVVSAGSLFFVLLESLLLFAHSVTCNSTLLNVMLSLFAVVHSGVVYTHLGPSSPFN